MNLTDFLAAEWKPALGCTEPAAIAWAASLAAAQGTGAVRFVRLVCDPRTYKNCYAVGLPNSERRAGILWALAIGSCLRDPSLGLRCFEQVDAEILAAATALVERRGLNVDVDPDAAELLVDVTVVREQGTGRALLERDHTRLTKLERDGRMVDGAAAGGTAAGAETDLREQAARLPVAALPEIARSATAGDRARLREGAAMNIAIARHGLSLMPARFVEAGTHDSLTRLSRLVASGVHARMSGEPMTVMSLAGSGNKGITLSVPLTLWGREAGIDEERIDEALAVGALLTSATTFHLGTLSAVCGAANAAGIGIAGAVVHLEGGSATQIGLAISNMVGNVAGMICDGAKIGCALKTMTGVDAAFRAASLALADVGIPASDGIVGTDGESSLANLGRLARYGMAATDTEILDIMQGKLQSA